MAGNALTARLIPGHAVLEPGCRRKINPKALHHAIHQLRLLQDPVQHRPAIAKVAHGESSFRLLHSLKDASRRRLT
jgi:hypothetical protein